MALDEGTISDNSQKPQSVSTDAGSVSQVSISEQIKADQYEQGKRAATRNARRGFYLSKVRLPGPVGTNQDADAV